MAKKRFSGLSTKVYEHPFDRQALVSLEKTPLLSQILKKINEYGIDRLLRLQSIGGDFRVTSRNFPRLHAAWIETCEILDINPSPDLYLYQGTGHINTYTIGVDQPVVGINLEAMEWLSFDELLFLLGHEVARIKGKYLAYQQLPYVMPLLKNLISSTTLGFGGLAANGLELALYNWIVMSKFTADRAGLLACQEIDVAITALMKIGGLPGEYVNDETIPDFVKQAREFSVDHLKGLDQFTKTLSFMEYRQPWAVMRASELLNWVDSGVYQELIQGNPSDNLQNRVQDDDENWDFMATWNEPKG